MCNYNSYPISVEAMERSMHYHVVCSIWEPDGYKDAKYPVYIEDISTAIITMEMNW